MPREVELPDGRILEIPDDATPEQLTVLKSRLREQFPDAAADAPPSRLDTIKERAAQAGREFALAGTQDPKSLRSALRSTQLGIASGAFGAGDRGVREGLKRVIPDASKEELEEGSRAFMRAAFEANPVSFGTGFAFGAVGSGGGAAKGVGAVASKAGPVGRAVARAFQTTRGQPIANAARGGAAGAAATAAQTGIAEERAPTVTETAFGAGLGAALPTLLTAGRTLLRPLTSRLAPQGAANVATIEAVQDVTGAGPQAAVEAVAERIPQIEAATGGPVAITEALAPREAASFGRRVGSRSEAAAEELTTGAVEQGARRAQRLRDVVTQGGPVAAAAEVRKSAQDRFTRVMRKQDPFGKPGLNLGARRVTIPNALAQQFASDRRFFSTLAPDAKDAIEQAITTNRPARITLSDLDETRQALNSAAQRVEVGGGRFKDLADNLRTEAGAQIPRFEKELRVLAQQEQRAEGIELGRRAIGGSAVESGAQVQRAAAEASRLADPKARAIAQEGRRGVSEGFRSALAERTGSARDSLTLAKEAATDVNFRGRIADALGGQESLRIAGKAGSELARAEGAETAAVAARREARLADSDEIGNIIELAAVSTGRGGAGFFANVTNGLIKKFDIPPKVAERMAKRAVDPRRAASFIRDLRKQGASEQQILELYRSAAIAGGIAGAQAPEQ